MLDRCLFAQMDGVSDGVGTKPPNLLNGTTAPKLAQLVRWQFVLSAPSRSDCAEHVQGGWHPLVLPRLIIGANQDDVMLVR